MEPDDKPVLLREGGGEFVDHRPPKMTLAHVGWLAVVATLGAATAAVGQEPTETLPGDRWTVDIEIDVTSDSGQLAIAPFYRVLEWQFSMWSSGAPLRLTVAPEAGFRLTYMRTELCHEVDRLRARE